MVGRTMLYSTCAFTGYVTNAVDQIVPLFQYYIVGTPYSPRNYGSKLFSPPWTPVHGIHGTISVPLVAPIYWRSTLHNCS